MKQAGALMVATVIAAGIVACGTSPLSDAEIERLVLEYMATDQEAVSVLLCGFTFVRDGNPIEALPPWETEEGGDGFVARLLAAGVLEAVGPEARRMKPSATNLGADKREQNTAAWTLEVTTKGQEFYLDDQARGMLFPNPHDCPIATFARFRTAGLEVLETGSVEGDAEGTLRAVVSLDQEPTLVSKLLEGTHEAVFHRSRTFPERETMLARTESGWTVEWLTSPSGQTLLQ